VIPLQDLYILDVVEFSKDLFRMGNSTWPGFSEDRARIDLEIRLINDVEVVIANGNGFSAFDHITTAMKKPGKKVWKIRKGAIIPHGLKLVEDKRPGHKGHYMIAPQESMPLLKFLGLLEELGMDRTRVVRVDVNAGAYVKY